VAPALSEAVLAALHKDSQERPMASELALALQPEVAALPSRLRLGPRGARL
jgi:hypothetical protein